MAATNEFPHRRATAALSVRRLFVSLVACVACAGAWGQTESRSAATAAVATFREALLYAASLPDVEARVAALREAVTATHDLDYIAQVAVRRQWSDFSPAQRSAYLSQFADLSIATYAARFATIDDESFVILDAEDVNGGRVQVHTQVLRADGSAVAIEYLLQPESQSQSESQAGLEPSPEESGEVPAERWRIVNVIADGVSDLALRRAEYRSLLEDVGIDGLLEELARQTREQLRGDSA